MNIQQYTDAVVNALRMVNHTIYSGKTGARRIAREYGVGLADFSEDEARRFIRNSYTMVCVVGYNLKPPIDAKEWISEVQKAYENAKR